MISRKKLVCTAALLATALLWTGQSYAAVDSYRYMHVSVETPYTIFLFLLAGILSPFILMGILVWRFIGRKSSEVEQPDDPPSKQGEEEK